MTHTLRSLSIAVCAAALAATLAAKPARRVATRLAQPDGTTVEAVFGGDEYMSFYTTRDGRRLARDAGGWWRAMTAAEVVRQDEQWAARRRVQAADQTQHGTADGGVPSTGERRLLTLLVEFSDLRFSAVGDSAHFEQMLNGDDYTSADTRDATGRVVRAGNAGSARQYFIDQSFGLYRPTFDIVGPITLDRGYAYYGRNNDANKRDMVVEAMQKAIADSLISDLSPYDTDGDGYVDLVYIFYAGYSEAEHAGDDYIWPHQANIYQSVSLGGTSVRRYACSSELQGTPADTVLVPDGIGSCCHEFGHALGLPDFYNTGSQTGCYGMDAWSVMDQGCYNGDGCVPPSYTAHERMLLGWATPDTLTAGAAYTLPPIGPTGKFYVVRCPSAPGEYYTIENHQNTGWDSFWGGYNHTPKHGMLITHVDYSPTLWAINSVNTDPSHQHCAPVPADGRLWAFDSVPSMTTAERSAWYVDYCGDIFPGRKGVASCDFSASPTFSGDELPIWLDAISESSDGDMTFVARSTDTHAIAPPAADRAAAAAATYDLSGRRLDGHGRSRGLYIERRADGTTRKVWR